jgi:hypothetical protein
LNKTAEFESLLAVPVSGIDARGFMPFGTTPMAQERQKRQEQLTEEIGIANGQDKEREKKKGVQGTKESNKNE